MPKKLKLIEQIYSLRDHKKLAIVMINRENLPEEVINVIVKSIEQLDFKPHKKEFISLYKTFTKKKLNTIIKVQQNNIFDEEIIIYSKLSKLIMNQTNDVIMKKVQNLNLEIDEMPNFLSIKKLGEC